MEETGDIMLDVNNEEEVLKKHKMNLKLFEDSEDEVQQAVIMKNKVSWRNKEEQQLVMNYEKAKKYMKEPFKLFEVKKRPRIFGVNFTGEAFTSDLEKKCAQLETFLDSLNAFKLQPQCFHWYKLFLYYKDFSYFSF